MTKTLFSPHDYHDDADEVFKLITSAEYTGSSETLNEARIKAGKLRDRLWDDGCEPCTERNTNAQSKNSARPDNLELVDQVSQPLSTAA